MSRSYKKPFVKMAKEAHAGKEPQRGGLLGVAVRRCQTAYFRPEGH